LLNVLVQIANKMGLKKLLQPSRVHLSVLLVVPLDSYELNFVLLNLDFVGHSLLDLRFEPLNHTFILNKWFLFAGNTWKKF
jgi:hypothetical protein